MSCWLNWEPCRRPVGVARSSWRRTGHVTNDRVTSPSVHWRQKHVPGRLRGKQQQLRRRRRRRQLRVSERRASVHPLVGLRRWFSQLDIHRYITRARSDYSSHLTSSHLISSQPTSLIFMSLNLSCLVFGLCHWPSARVINATAYTTEPNWNELNWTECDRAAIGRSHGELGVALRSEFKRWHEVSRDEVRWGELTWVIWTFL